MTKLLVTGSSALIGSEVVDYFCKQGGRSSASTTTSVPTSSAGERGQGLNRW
jgi:hypothetical protein